MDSIFIENIEEYIGEISREDLLKLEKEEGVEAVICGTPTIGLKFIDKKLAFSMLAEKFGHIFPHMHEKKAAR